MSVNSLRKSRKENPQKLTQLSSRSHPRHLVGKRTAQKDTIIGITSDSQVNSNFPNRWSPASLTFNNYFYLFLYLYSTDIVFLCNENAAETGAKHPWNYAFYRRSNAVSELANQMSVFRNEKLSKNVLKHKKRFWNFNQSNQRLKKTLSWLPSWAKRSESFVKTANESDSFAETMLKALCKKNIIEHALSTCVIL